MNTLHKFSNGKRSFGIGFRIVNTTVTVTVKSLLVQFKLVTFQHHFSGFQNIFFVHTTEM